MEVINTKNLSDFNKRQKNIESLLDEVEKEYSKSITTKINKKKVTGDVIQKQKLDMKVYKKEESIFRKPYKSPPRIRKNKEYVPDFKLNPHKWKKYSLSDVPIEDTSEASNTNTAFALLKKLEQRKKSVCNMDIDNNSEEVKPVFRKPHKYNLISDKVSDDENKCSFVGSKLIMPEYAIGCKKQKKEKLNVDITLSQTDSKEIKLNHLSEFDDNEE